ncbi:MAG: T9SS type A sorting domain-containing protein [Candidatus Marinimicrobia bacterium]|nr:T9SS type A sorting domain-containing protein [Candidatus Neomarinimicrobiota bacterium]
MSLQSDEFVFSAGYPNPFNPSFVVPFELYSPQSVDIRLYDMTGRQVRVIADSELPAGTYNILVDGSDLSSGTYLLRARVDNVVKTQKMLLVK